MLRVVLLGATCWIATVFLAILTFGVVASWARPGTFRLGPALGIYFTVVILSLAGSVLAVRRGVARLLEDPRLRVVAVMVFGSVQTVTFAFLAFVGILGFNR